MLRSLRLAAHVSLDDAAAAAGVTPRRIRELESGEDLPNYFEALELVKPYLLCQPCFAKHLRVAAARDGAIEAASVALLTVLGADQSSSEEDNREWPDEGEAE
jgi:transcriptional regulator with XRE-family HTH domain